MIFSDRLAIRGTRARIPKHVSSALGLDASDTLHAVYIKDPELGLLEVDLTPVPRRAWQDTWRLEAVLANRPGLLFSLSSLLSNHGIDILFTRGICIRRDDAFQLDMHLDLSRYVSELDGTSRERSGNPLRRLVGLRAEISLCLLDSLHFVAPQKPLFSLRKNLPLFRAFGHPGDYRQFHVSDRTIDLAHVLPQALGEVSCYAVADEDNLVIRLFLPDSESPLEHFRLEVDDVVGALRSVAGKLLPKSYDIHQVYVRPAAGGKCQIDMAVKRDYAVPTQRGQRKKNLRTILAASKGSVQFCRRASQ